MNIHFSDGTLHCCSVDLHVLPSSSCCWLIIETVCRFLNIAVTCWWGNTVQMSGSFHSPSGGMCEASEERGLLLSAALEQITRRHAPRGEAQHSTWELEKSLRFDRQQRERAGP
uniref:Uncharacterized protein n=1 Tax=Knipowitschia caucasica TaxID=637954 RepID=A0AAV2L785_KNICA